MSNLTVAITIQDKDKNMIGPNNGCPILYMRDTGDAKTSAIDALTSEEFYNYLVSKNCFSNVSAYVGTKIFMSWHDDDGNSDGLATTLQDVWAYDFIKEHGNDLPMLSWIPVYNALKYIWEASFPDEKICPLSYNGDLSDPSTYNEVVDVYNKVLDKYKEKLSKQTFIQSINSWLQRREKFNLTEHNITYLVEEITNILSVGSN